MVDSRNAVWLGLLLGCNYQPAANSPTGDGALADSSVDGATDSAVDTAVIPALIDRGLVVRYFMDEAASGTTPANLIDSATAPLALPITYGQASYIEDNGHRGLHWPAVQSTGKAELSFGSSKLITQLSPSKTVTIEVVAQISNAGTGGGNESQITGLRGSNPDFVLAAVGANDLRFFKPFGNESATWTGANNQQRMVLHLVFDTTQANAEARVQLFENGTLLTKTTSAPPNLNSTVGLAGSDEIMIGNRQQQDRSFQGSLFYVAYYKVALDGNEIANNTQRLLATDDL